MYTPFRQRQVQFPLGRTGAKLVRYPVEQMQTWHQRVLTHDEYRTLLTGAQTLTERTLIRIMREAGLRAGETIALQIGDLYLDQGLIHIQRRHYRLSDGTTDIDTPKSHKPRWAAINPSLAAELQEVIEGRENDAEAYVWTRTNQYTAGETRPYTASALKKMLRRVASNVGMDAPVQGRYISPHLLRATGASLAVAAGIPEHIAAKRRHYRLSDGSTDVDTPKSHKPRWAAINPSLVAELREVIEGWENDAEAYVWTRTNRYTDSEARAFTASALKKMFRRVARNADMDHPVQGRYISPHLLRATGASLAVAAGVTEHIAAKQLGHARIDTTRKHYLRLPVIEPLRAIGEVFE